MVRRWLGRRKRWRDTRADPGLARPALTSERRVDELECLRRRVPGFGRWKHGVGFRVISPDDQDATVGQEACGVRGARVDQPPGMAQRPVSGFQISAGSGVNKAADDEHPRVRQQRDGVLPVMVGGHRTGRDETAALRWISGVEN